MGAGRRATGRALAASATGYLVLSWVLWSGAWLHHPTTTTTCGCGDASLFTWFLAWPAHAIAHGQNPLFSGAMFHPAGVNLLANTGVVAIGTVLAPVTWIFGPTATLNVASTLAPATSALSMYVLLRRWVSWAPAAFAGGLFYGFSPFILVSLSVSHLMLAMAVVPPLVVLCLDELLIRHEHRPVPVGIGLGLLITLQFFIGTEVLLIVVIVGAVGVVFLMAAGLARPERLRWHARRAAPGLVAAGATAGLLLAYPLWFALAGPAHLSGPIWPTGLSHDGGTLREFLFPTPSPGGWSVWTKVVGQYQGPLLSDQYLGIGVLGVVATGSVIWRRDRRLWFFAAVTVLSLWLDLGARPGGFLPWRAVATLPLFENVVPNRFMLPALVALGIMLAIVLDHAYATVHRLAGQAERRRTPATLAVVATLAVASIALVPFGTYLRAIVPVTTRPVLVPRWFQAVAPRLPASAVLLVLPVPSVRQSALTWQASVGMPYAAASGSGPADDLSRAGPFRRAEAVLYNASTAEHPQRIEPGDPRAVRSALDGWGVSTVVIPDQHGLPEYEEVSSVPFAVGLMVAVTGHAPVHQHAAWVWYGVDHDPVPATGATAPLAACTDGAGAGRRSTPDLISCVLQVSRGSGRLVGSQQAP